MYTNVDIHTNKMLELKVQTAEYLPLIIAVTEVISKNYRISVQKAQITVSDDYDVFPDNTSCIGRGVTIQIHKSLKVQEVYFASAFQEFL